MSSARRAARPSASGHLRVPGPDGVGSVFMWTEEWPAGGGRLTLGRYWKVLDVLCQWASSLTLFYLAHFNPVYQNFTWSTPPHHVTRRTQHLIGM